MNPEYRKIAATKFITKNEWQDLVFYLNHDTNLALATRMFYCVNTHSTHPFDYYVPDKMKENVDCLGMGIVRDYQDRARAFLAILKTISGADLSYLSAVLVGQLNQN